jgi:hypothetical protein
MSGGLDLYLWDFWTIYDSPAVWSDEHQMPVPSFWQSQLPRVPSNRVLNATAFAAEVDALLARAPDSGGSTAKQ